MLRRQKIRKGIILISFFLFPAIFFYMSPAIIIMASAQGIINGSFIVFASLFFASLFVGRFFCGWICPGAGCQEALFLARDKKITRGNWVKWLIWIPWIAAIAILAVKAGGYHSVDFFFMTTHGLSAASVEGLLIYMAVILFLLVLPSLIFGKRAFCHHLCWKAPFMILGRKISNRLRTPALKLKSDPGKCRKCGLCSEHCPMSLPVEEMVSQSKMENSECILCLTCFDVCKQRAITYSWKNDIAKP